MSQSPARPLIIHDPARYRQAMRSPARRRLKNRIFVGFCLMIASMSIVILAVLLTAIVWRGVTALDWNFITSPPDTEPGEAGIYPSLLGTVWVCAVCAVVALPLGVATAVFLEEFQPRTRWLRRFFHFVQLNIANLAGVPSVVYGIIGLTAFVWLFGFFGSPKDPMLVFGVKYYDQYFNESYQVVLVPAPSATSDSRPLEDGMTVFAPDQQEIELNLIGPDAPWPDNEQLAARTVRTNAEPGRISEQTWYYFQIPFGRGVLAGGLTLMLVILPIVIIASQEALRAVPDSLREGAMGLGATRWQVVRRITLPSAIPGIMTGSIIAMSRAIGEAAPLLMIAGIVFITNPPQNLMDDFTAMPLQIYNWAQRPQTEFHDLAASGIVVLLAVLLLFNGAAVFIRHQSHKRSL